MNARRTLRILLCLASTGFAAQCRPAPTLESRPYFDLLPAAYAPAAIAVSPEGTVWIGEAGAVSEFGADGARLRRVELGAPAAASITAFGAETMLLRTAAELVVVDRRTGAVRARAAADGAAEPLLTERIGYLLQPVPSGAVLASDLDSLRHRWSWPRLDRAPTASAVSPLGDRVYMAVVATAAAAPPSSELLIRDLQSGRILGRRSWEGAVHAMQAAANGDLFLLQRNGDRAFLLRVRPQADDLEVVWRQRLAPWEGEMRLRVAPDATRIAVLSGRAGDGVTIVDGARGATVAALNEHPIDAVFAADGTLLLLYDAEVRVLR
jgi:hypothetical protein